MLKNELTAMLRKYGIPYTQSQIAISEKYMEYILKMNESINLTAIKDPEQFRELMTLDSLILLKDINIDDKTLLDVGTGAGFPGVILSIFSKAKVTLLDSTAKKINAINDFKGINVNTVVGRAEEYARDHRELYDIVTARAVSSLNVLVELCLPLVKVGGYLVAYKGKNAALEVEDAKSAINKLGGEMEYYTEDLLPNGEERHLVFIKKIKETNKKYPRDYSSISSKPL
ncbi:MAG: 16S rRNA (guanine(527)-N(7))-methyltransferase RsmG [Bacilli bacterium]|nr:16S rRNA (guanine(527)-N(7))-methyltransferase RsmG [Bacilli bacterium]